MLNVTADRLCQLLPASIPRPENKEAQDMQCLASAQSLAAFPNAYAIHAILVLADISLLFQ